MEMAEKPVCPGEWPRLLVCTDGSAESQGAVAEALALARLCASQVYVLQVLEIVPEFEAVAPDLLPRLEEEIRTQLEGLKAETAKMAVPITTRVRRDVSVFSAILEEAQQIKPAMIIMGRYGRSGLARLLMGSVTARVIGHSQINVLVVPRQAILAFRRILVASDGSPYSRAAWEEALAIAKRAGSVLVGVSVAEEEGELELAEQIVHQMRVTANQHGILLQGLVPLEQTADDAIVQAALKNEVDLIVLGSHGRTGLTRLLMGSVTERVIGHAPQPVLVVKKS
jgi:nucleotide-binding universal stress UspA family protein